MRYFVGITLPEGLAKEVDSKRKQFYPKAVKMHPPHITLFPPFSPFSELTDLTAPLRRATKEIEPFTITAKGLGTFEKRGNNVIYIDIPVTEELSFLHHEVKRHLTPLVKGANFNNEYTAHITIGNRLSKKEYERALKALQTYEPSFSFNVKEIVLFQKENKALKWIEAEQVSLLED